MVIGSIFSLNRPRFSFDIFINFFFTDNRLKLFVNGIVTINTRTIANILEMDYFSFATTIDGESQELFYNCSP